MLTSKEHLTFGERAKLSTNPTAKRLFQLMEEKKTNLAVGVDVTSADQFLQLADTLGDQICVLKTHVDMLLDYTPDVAHELRKIADARQFLIFEDRKFADIGNTVLQQYAGGIYKIAEWAEITNAHIVPGEGIIEGLKKVGLPKDRGLLLLAEMSSKGTLATGAYTQKAVEMAKNHSDFVIGFIAMGKITCDPRFVHMTPGIRMHSGGDLLGQQYKTPRMAIENGTDVIIVARDIVEASDPKQAAALYRKEAWDAYAASR